MLLISIGEYEDNHKFESLVGLVEFIVLAISAFSIWKPNETIIMCSIIFLILSTFYFFWAMGLLAIFTLLILGPVILALFIQIVNIRE